MRLSGELRLNGHEYTATLKQMAAYVMQDDLLNAHLTVEETLLYTAQLRLSPQSPEDLEQAVEKVISLLGLHRCRHRIIGDALNKGISGGERKRVCVAMEMLTQPLLLFLDEPTSGLDSVTALSLCLQLKALANSGACTIICTIHQPQSKIFDLFDKLSFFGVATWSTAALLEMQSAPMPKPVSRCPTPPTPPITFSM